MHWTYHLLLCTVRWFIFILPSSPTAVLNSAIEGLSMEGVECSKANLWFWATKWIWLCYAFKTFLHCTLLTVFQSSSSTALNWYFSYTSENLSISSTTGFECNRNQLCAFQFKFYMFCFSPVPSFAKAELDGHLLSIYSMSNICVSIFSGLCIIFLPRQIFLPLYSKWQMRAARKWVEWEVTEVLSWTLTRDFCDYMVFNPKATRMSHSETF